MENDELARAIEAVLFVAVEPVLPGLLAELLEEPVERIEEVLTALAEGYVGRGSRLRPGPHRRWRPPADPSRPRPLCRALRQPRRLTPPVDGRPRDAGHRGVPPAGLPRADLVVAGVNVDGVTRLLEQRGYIEVVGRADGPGQPALYGTTDLFLERLGLDALSQLPPVEDFLPGPEVAGEFESDLQAALGVHGEVGPDDV